VSKDLYVGIDPGVKTGIAIWDAYNEVFTDIATTGIIKAMEVVSELHGNGRIIEIRLEDARMVKYKTNPAAAQGAGSVKRDCKVWEEFFKHIGVEYVLRRPDKKISKLDAKAFQMITKVEARTSNHARDAAMLVYKLPLK
jgi:hypothetical protein